MNMLNNPRLLFCAFSLLFLFSCSTENKKLNILIDAHYGKAVKLIFDGKDTLTIARDTSLLYSTTEGVHKVSVNDSTAKEFTVGEKGGLLNLNNREFVAYEIKYVSQDNSRANFADFNDFVLKSTILIDSFVVVPNGLLSKADSSIRQILPKLRESGTYYSGGIHESDDAFHGLKKFGKNKLFVDKFWDYDLFDEIPQTISVQTSKYAVGNTSATRSSILPVNTFLIYAFLNKDEFTVKSVKSIMEGTEDKAKQKELENKQMAF